MQLLNKNCIYFNFIWFDAGTNLSSDSSSSFGHTYGSIRLLNTQKHPHKKTPTVMKYHKERSKSEIGKKKMGIRNSFRVLHSWVILLSSHWFKKLGHAIKHLGILSAKEPEWLSGTSISALRWNMAQNILSRIRLKRTYSKTIRPCFSKSTFTLIYRAKCKEGHKIKEK